jgi:hypothetical protein
MPSEHKLIFLLHGDTNTVNELHHVVHFVWAFHLTTVDKPKEGEFRNSAKY